MASQVNKKVLGLALYNKMLKAQVGTDGDIKLLSDSPKSLVEREVVAKDNGTYYTFYHVITAGDYSTTNLEESVTNGKLLVMDLSTEVRGLKYADTEGKITFYQAGVKNEIVLPKGIAPATLDSSDDNTSVSGLVSKDTLSELVKKRIDAMFTTQNVETEGKPLIKTVVKDMIDTSIGALEKGKLAEATNPLFANAEIYHSTTGDSKVYLRFTKKDGVTTLDVDMSEFVRTLDLGNLFKSVELSGRKLKFYKQDGDDTADVEIDLPEDVQDATETTAGKISKNAIKDMIETEIADTKAEADKVSGLETRIQTLETGHTSLTDTKFGHVKVLDDGIEFGASESSNNKIKITNDSLKQLLGIKDATDDEAGLISKNAIKTLIGTEVTKAVSTAYGKKIEDAIQGGSYESSTHVITLTRGESSSEAAVSIDLSDLAWEAATPGDIFK